jgi:hypothetical protein
MVGRRSLAHRIPTLITMVGHFHLESPLTIIIGSYVNACMQVSREVIVVFLLMTKRTLLENEIPTSRTSTRRDDPSGSGNQADVADADKMPDNWILPGTLAFFLWGFIIENEEDHDVYKS